MEIALIVVVIGLIAGVAVYVWNQKNSSSLNSSLNSAADSSTPEKQATTTEAQAKYSSFVANPIGGLTHRGKCKSGEVLFAPIYNTEGAEGEFEYDCQGPVDAIQYVSVVFGQSSSSVLGLFGGSSEKGTSVVLANDVPATKYTFTGEKKGHGTSDMYLTRYVIYEVDTGNNFFYALYWTGIGFSDENAHLDDFNALALENWEIK